MTLLPLPMQPNRVAQMRELRSLWLGPTEWLVTAPAIGVPDLAGRLARAVADRISFVRRRHPLVHDHGN